MRRAPSSTAGLGTLGREVLAGPSRELASSRTKRVIAKMLDVPRGATATLGDGTRVQLGWLGAHSAFVHRDGGWPEPLPLDTAVVAVDPIARGAVESAPVEDPLRQRADDGELFGGAA